MSQAETIKIAVGEFGASAKAKLNEGGQPEDQPRNPIEQLFAALSLEIGLPKVALTLIAFEHLHRCLAISTIPATDSVRITRLHQLLLFIAILAVFGTAGRSHELF